MTALAQHLKAWTAQEDPEACWLWQGPRHSKGYGGVKIAQRQRLVHRVVYEFLREPIPRGLQIDHLCRVRACANPRHLEAVTCRVNLLRGAGLPARGARATTCPQGHPYDAANTYRYTTARGTPARGCRICRRAASTAWNRSA